MSDYLDAIMARMSAGPTPADIAREHPALVKTERADITARYGPVIPSDAVARLGRAVREDGRALKRVDVWLDEQRGEA